MVSRRLPLICSMGLLIGLAGADAPSVSSPDEIAKANYDKAVAHANVVYSKMLAAADKQYLAALKSAELRAKHAGKDDEVTRIDQEIDAVTTGETDHAALGDETDALTKTPPSDAVDPSDPMASAIRHHKVVKGMTEEQMEEALQFNADSTAVVKGAASWTATPTITKKDSTQEYKWSIGFTTTAKGYTETRVVTATLNKDNIVTDVSETRVQELDDEPQ